MRHITSEFLDEHPECLNIDNPLDLMLELSDSDTIPSLAGLLSITSAAEYEYRRLCQLRWNRVYGKPYHKSPGGADNLQDSRSAKSFSSTPSIHSSTF